MSGTVRWRYTVQTEGMQGMMRETAASMMLGEVRKCQ
jgi:hypothetical protein